MARLTQNLKLRVADNLTADAVYNLDRIDLLGDVFPLGSSNDVTIQSSGNIILNPQGSTSINSSLVIGGTLTLPAGQYTTSIQTGTQTGNITLTLPDNNGNAGQFLSNDGTGLLTWSDPPTSNFETLNDTAFSNLLTGQVAQWDGTIWRNVSLPNTLQSGTFTWQPLDGLVKTITHNYNSTNIEVWIYDTESGGPVVVEGVDYLDSNTIVLTALKTFSDDYIVHLQQTQ